MRYIGYIEISVGVGLGLGPTIGSVVYKYLAYEDTMYFFAGLDFLALISCAYLIPSVLNNTVSSEVLSEIRHKHEDMVSMRSLEKKKTITWCTLLSNKHAMFALLTCFVGTFNITFFQGFIANELVLLGLS